MRLRRHRSNSPAGSLAWLPWTLRRRWRAVAGWPLAAALAGLLLPACGPATPAQPAAAVVAANPDAELFVEPEDGAEPILNEIDAAKSAIDVEMYLLTDKPVTSALTKAERRGVQVRVLLERRPFGLASGNNASFATLQRAGAQARWSDPRFKLTHEKTAIVDDREALILTLNLTASAFSRNREYGVIDHTPEDVMEAEAIFNADWSHTAYQPTRPDLVVSPDNARTKMLRLIAQARHSLDLESEEVQDAGIDQALTEAAKRGVTVRLVLSPAESGPDSNAKGVRRLKAGGVQVRYMRKPYVHAKIMIADGQTAFAGSENISSQSLDGNRELGLFLSQPAAVQRMAATFEQDWQARS